MGYPVKLHLHMPGMINPLNAVKPLGRASADRLADVVQVEIQAMVDRMLAMRADCELESIEVVINLRYKK